MKRTIAIACLLAFAVSTWADKNPEPPADTPKVRALKVTRVPFNLGGKSTVTVCKSQAELEKATSKALATELAKQVKFASEQVVVVSYQTSGPPYGVLKHEIKGKGKKSVEFYVLEPKVGARGQALKLGLEFFAVSKGAAVTFGKAR